MSGISLTSSMRNNLLSLQQTAKLQNLTQNRLATGLKVNSAIDNPSSYYTAQSLNNRADDLNILLDAMSQGIQTLKAVNESLEAGTKFLEQAKSVANTALEYFSANSQPVIARVKTEQELLEAVNSGQKGLIVIDADIAMSENQSITLSDGQSLVGAGYLDKTAAAVSISFNITETKNAVNAGSNSIISDLAIDFKSVVANTGKIEELSALKVSGTGTFINNLEVTTEVNATGFAIMKAIDISDSDVTFGAINIEAKANKGAGFLMSYGISGDNAKAKFIGDAMINTARENNSQSIRVGGNLEFVENAKLISSSSVQASQIIVANQAELNVQGGIPYSNLTLKDSAAVNIFDGGISSSSWTNNVVLEGRSQLNITGNSAASALKYVHLFLNSAQARVNARSDVRDLDNLKMTSVVGATVMTNDGVFVAQSGISDAYVHGSNPGSNFVKTGDYDASVFPSPVAAADSDAEADIPEKAKGYSEQFNQIINQYDNLINDSWYKGVNLLKGQDLKVVFNESRTADLEIKGVDGTARGLGLESAAWDNTAVVQKSLNKIDAAINQLRLYASEFGNYYQIVTTRENFTNSLINVLTEGADALTLADMNQESANMLALQTRQQLAVNSLSLASQASQSVLKLF